MMTRVTFSLAACLACSVKSGIKLNRLDEIVEDDGRISLRWRWRLLASDSV